MHCKQGTCKVRNEIETKRNETERNEIKRNEIKRNETKRRYISFRFVSIGFISFRSVSFRFVSFLFRFALYRYSQTTGLKTNCNNFYFQAFHSYLGQYIIQSPFSCKLPKHISFPAVFVPIKVLICHIYLMVVVCI